MLIVRPVDDKQAIDQLYILYTIIIQIIYVLDFFFSRDKPKLLFFDLTECVPRGFTEAASSFSGLSYVCPTTQVQNFYLILYFPRS